MTGYKKMERLIEFDHASGLRVQIIPKPGFYKKFAIFSVRYGSVDNHFVDPYNKKPIRVPDGVAHFLEHKLFDQKDGNALDKLAALGASPNAATGFNWTYYYFTSTDNFYSPFELLLDFVLNPYITEESVEKEKGIIGQEINMYLDDPEFMVSMNLLKSLYHKHPIREDIAGSIGSIEKIDSNILLTCHKSFYDPSNMCLTVVGDVDVNEIEGLVDKHIPKKRRQGEIERIFEVEPTSIKEKTISVNMDVAMPLFNIGLKDIVRGLKGIDRVRHEVTVSILKEILFGKSSAFYEDLYNRGLINQTFYTNYDIGDSYSLFSLGGESKDPDLLIDDFNYYIEKKQKEGLEEEDFIRVKRALAGRLLRRFNVPESMGRLFASSYLQGVCAFDYFNTYDKISNDEAYSLFCDLFTKPMACSLVKPI